MKPTYLLIPLILLSAAAMVGCATDSTAKQTAKQEPAKDQRPPEERIKVGMTKDEVKSALGEPSGKTTNSDGLENWSYSDHAKMWIPFYGISGGKFQNIHISFNPEGKVKSWTTGKTGLF